MFRKQLLLSLLFLGTQSAIAHGSGPEADSGTKNASVAVETKVTGDNLQFSFKAAAKDGMEINLEGPWKLEVKGHEGLTLAKTSFAKGEMDEKLPGFVIATAGKPAKLAGDLEYTMVAFVCTKDKTQCFREVHSGKTEWKVTGK